MRRCAGLAGVVLLVAGCGDGGPDRVGGDAARPRIAEASDFEFRPIGCVDSVVGRARAVVRAERVEDTATRSWAPSSIGDVVQTANGFAAIDPPTAEAALFAPSLELVSVFAREGGGPGELRRPQALAYDDERDRIWILDGRSSRVESFDADGRYLDGFRIERQGSDIAVLGNGHLAVASDVMVPMMRMRPEQAVPLVIVYDTSGAVVQRLAEVDLEAVQADREAFVLPGPNAVRVAAHGDTVAVAFPSAGVIDLYAAGRPLRRLSVCMPEETRALYGRQLAEADESTSSQAGLSFIADLRFEADGSLRVLGPLSTSEGDAYVNRFPPGEDERARTTVIDGDEQVGFSRLTRDGWITWRLAGDLRRVTLEPTAPGS